MIFFFFSKRFLSKEEVYESRYTKLALYLKIFFFQRWSGVPRPDILNLVSSIKQEGNLQFNPE